MISTIIIFIVILSILVFTHELGHFSAAKLFGAKVEEFAIGFPPKLFGFKKGETQYNINLLPLGGYVKIKGEGGEFKDEKDSFSSKPIWQRSIIVFAGVLMNFISAVLFFAIGFSLGLPVSLDSKLDSKAQVKNEAIQIVEVIPNFPAAKNDLKLGDVILNVDGSSLKEISEIQNYLNNKQGEKAVFEIKRGEEIFFKDISTTRMENGSFGIGVALIKTGVISYSPFFAIIEAVKKTFWVIGQIFVSLGLLIRDLFWGEKVGLPVSGPIGIAVLTGQMSKLGWSYLLQFIAILAINLGVINLMPFPALDGSRLIFLLVEKLRKKPISQKIEGITHSIGFGILMFIMVLVTFKDFTRYGSSIWQKVMTIFS